MRCGYTTLPQPFFIALTSLYFLSLRESEIQEATDTSETKE